MEITVEHFPGTHAIAVTFATADKSVKFRLGIQGEGRYFGVKEGGGVVVSSAQNATELLNMIHSVALDTLTPNKEVPLYTAVDDLAVSYGYSINNIWTGVTG